MGRLLICNNCEPIQVNYHNIDDEVGHDDKFIDSGYNGDILLQWATSYDGNYWKYDLDH